MFSNKKKYKKKNRGAAALFIVSAAFVLLMLGLHVEDYYQSQIVINEICSDNESYALGEEEQFDDYVEIYNKGRFDYRISGLYLSDDPYELKKISLDGVDISAGSVFVVACVDSGNSFSINNKGEVIYLSNEDGEILDKVEVGKLESDIAYIRNTEGKWQIGNCTPGVSNDTAIRVSVEMPVLSHASGFYDKAFDLEITSSEDTVIYYTLDGSVPDEGSHIYEGAITVYDKSQEPNVGLAMQNVVRNWQEYEPDAEPVEKAFLIRAIAMDNAGNKSDVVTATYFVGLEDYIGHDVVSLIVDPKDLYDSETGIYVTGAEYDAWYLNGQEGDQPIPNFRKKGREWEREGAFELFSDGESIFQQNVGVRVQGASGREFALKRFSIYARDEYSGSDKLMEPLYDNEVTSHSVVLRDVIADAICQEFAQDRDIPYQRSRRVYLFVNGEFWQRTYIREKYSSQYFEDYYGIDKDNLIVIEGNAVGSGVETDMVHFNEFYDYVVENDFSDDTMYRELGDMMDIPNFIDFLCFNIYCGNMDIAFEKTKNVVMWKSRDIEQGDYSDCKWRFALYDMDSMQWNSLEYYEVDNRAEINSFSQKPEHADLPYNQSFLYAALRKNADFCEQFVVTFMDLLNTNFKQENAAEVLWRYGKKLEWTDSYYELRPEYIKKYMAEEFELTGTIETITLHNEDETQGKIILNTITPDMKNGSWTGEYFTDYPVTVTAQPMEGYEFAGWSGSIESDEITIEVPVSEGGIELRAEFQKIE